MSYPEFDDLEQAAMDFCVKEFKALIGTDNSAENLLCFLDGCSRFTKVLDLNFECDSEDIDRSKAALAARFKPYRLAIHSLFYDIMDLDLSVVRASTLRFDNGEPASIEVFKLLRKCIRHHIQYGMDMTLRRMFVVASVLASSLGQSEEVVAASEQLRASVIDYYKSALLVYSSLVNNCQMDRTLFNQELSSIPTFESLAILSSYSSELATQISFKNNQGK